MAKIHLDRITKKYGWKGHNYKVLMSAIIADNSQKIHNSVNQIDHSYLDSVMKRVRTKEQIINLPKLSEIIKPKSVFLRKGAERGDLITENLKNKLSNDIRSVLEKPEYFRTRGALTGTLKNKAFIDIQDKMLDTFKNYTRYDSSIGIPSNIKNIVTTEVRSVVNQTKQEFYDKLLRKNPDTIITKRWIHNGNIWGSRDYKARFYHKLLHMKEIGFSENFKIRDEKKNITYSAPYPHYETLPSEQVIGCSCGVQYILRKLPKRESGPKKA